MAVDYRALFGLVQTALVDHALTTGLFGQVNGHEPKNVPGELPTLSLFTSGVRPARTSGLTATSIVLEFTGRVTGPGMVGDLDEVERVVMGAALGYWAALVADLDLGLDALTLPAPVTMWGLDPRGAHGTPTRVEPGYLVQDSTMLRAATLTIPIVLDDALPEVP